MTFLATFDIEDWFHAANLEGSLPTSDWDRLEPRVERNTHELLDVLAETGSTATFFVLGWIARRYPALVRRIVEDGHEVASHTDRHRLLYELPRDELRRDLADARDSLEQVAGTRVWGVRAPSFSLDDGVLDCLAEAGYWYDSSLHVFGAHGRYGRLERVPDGDEPVVEIRPGLLELPMSRLPLGRLRLPWAGGGYFRLIPYGVYRRGVARVLRRDGWFMFYLHPWELDADEQPPAGMPAVLRFRAYVSRTRTRRDLARLLTAYGSERVDRTLLRLGYEPPAEPVTPSNTVLQAR